MRRKQCEITDPAEIERILNSTNIGRLATNGEDGYPYITPVNFVFHEGNIYFHCARVGEKLDNILRDPKVCFEVDIPLAYLGKGLDPEGRACMRHQLYYCVIVRGAARVVPDGPLKLAALNALVTKHEHGSDFEPINSDSPGYASCVVIEITPTSVSAKSDLRQNRTAEERLAIARYLKTRIQPSDLDALRAMGFKPEDV